MKHNLLLIFSIIFLAVSIVSTAVLAAEVTGNLSSSAGLTGNVSIQGNQTCGDGDCGTGENCGNCEDDCGCTGCYECVSNSCEYTVSPTCPGGGGGGGGAAVPGPSQTFVFDQIAENTTASISVTKAGIAITDLNITVNTTVYNAGVTISALTGLPATIAIAGPDSVYQYLSISLTGFSSADISNVVIGFKVSKSWLTSSGIDSSTITLNRWTGTAWTPLPTTTLREDSEYIYFSATSPGLSYFSITGKPKAALQCPTCPNAGSWTDCINNTQIRTNYRCSSATNYTCQAYSESQSCGAPAVTIPEYITPGFRTEWFVGALVAIFAIIAGFYWFILQRQPKAEHIKEVFEAALKSGILTTEERKLLEQIQKTPILTVEQKRALRKTIAAIDKRLKRQTKLRTELEQKLKKISK